MRLDQTASANECRRQALVIERLSEVVSTFRRGAEALKAENSELRVENERLRDRGRFRRRVAGRVDDGELVEATISLDVQAPGAARTIVAQCLEERVAASGLDSARLLVSELVSNSVRHSGGPAGDELVVSVELMPDWFRIGVRDSGSGAVIGTRPASIDTDGGFGLNLVQLLSDRWGVERLSGGGTQVWAQLARAPLGGAGDTGCSGSRNDLPRAG
jgi:anti-sigma regulatory factor (Ser/Thr protein kinase)